MDFLSKSEYEASIAATRNKRMQWWREARFGMFIHYGLYSILGRQEWVMANENITVPEYEQLADRFSPKPGAPASGQSRQKKPVEKITTYTQNAMARNSKKY